MTANEMQKVNLSIIKNSYQNAIKGVRKKHSYSIIDESNAGAIKRSFITKGEHCYVRADVDYDISVRVRIKTLNFEGRCSYQYYQFSEKDDINLDDYKKCTTELFDYLFSEALNIPFCPEHRYEMTPSNATDTEIKSCSWCTVWEHRMIEEHSYSELEKLHEWIERCTGKNIKLERYSFDCVGDYWKKEAKLISKIYNE